MLKELDDAGWNELAHAYGPATDTPELLRQLTSPDAEVVAEALDELYGSINHQGTVYPATVAAVPHLMEAAGKASHHRADIVWLLGRLADDRTSYGQDFPAVRAAVAEQRPGLLALLTDEAADVREAAVYAATLAGAEAHSLWALWPAETDLPVRASLLLALGRLDPIGASSLLAEQVEHGSPPVRVAAALALQRADLPWPVDPVVTAIDASASVAYDWAPQGDWYDELLVSDSLLDALLRSPVPATRRIGLWGMEGRCNESRSAPARFVARLAAACEDPDEDVRAAALKALASVGSAAAPYASLLAEPLADREIGALALLGDPRWVDAACALAAAGKRLGTTLEGARFSPPAVAAVLARLTAEPERADVLATVLGGWRVEAGPELVAALTGAGRDSWRQITWALLQIGYEDPAAVARLRDRAAEFGDVSAALAVRGMTGDAEPLLNLVRGALTEGKRVLGVPEFDDEFRPLLPAAHALLTGAAAKTYPQRETQLIAARLVAALDDPSFVVATVRAILEAGETPARSAADLVGELRLQGFEQPLRDRLGDSWSRLAAARALLRLGVPAAELAPVFIDGISDYAGRFALDMIHDLRIVEAAPALERLISGDARVHAPGLSTYPAWADELFVERAHEILRPSK